MWMKSLLFTLFFKVREKKLLLICALFLKRKIGQKQNEMTNFYTNLSILSPNMSLNFAYFVYFKTYNVKYLKL